MTVGSALRQLLADGALDLPPIGSGHTADRWLGLAEIARGDLSLGRLAEAHVDGRQILAEAGVSHPAHRLLGVWASEHPRHTVHATVEGGVVALHGSKGFCTGAGIVDDALVTATTTDARGPLLVLVPVAGLQPGRIDLASWQTPALRDTCTATVSFAGIELPATAVVGAPGWYLDRPGFWQGAIGPAACWGGGAIGLVDHARAHAPDDPHATAHLGAMVAGGWTIRAVLAAAGHALDAEPVERVAPAADGVGAPGGLAGERDHRLALVTRHAVDAACEDVQRHAERGLGPRALAGDAAFAERHQALTLYRRQCHAERDLEALGQLARP